MFLQESDGKTLSPNSRVPVIRRKGRVASKSANIRQVLLKFILRPAFHLLLQRKDVCHINPFTLQLLLLVQIWNSTKVLENVRCDFSGPASGREAMRGKACGFC
jgi:hypothetical protein